MKHSARYLTPLLLIASAQLLYQCDQSPTVQSGGGGGQGGEGAGGDGADGKTVEEKLDGPVKGEFPIPLVEGPAPTPPMGWNSWNKLGCGNVTASRIRGAADAMVESGMKDAGYEYVNIDDCWAERERTEDGLPQTTSKFPDGIKAVADYVHDLGLKLGIYSDRGESTCARRVGSRGHEMEDAKLYADWGVDYLKHDNCDYISEDSWDHAVDDERMQAEFELMGEALKASGRDIVYSVCAWQYYEWAVPIGSLWRTTGDIVDEWSMSGGANENGVVQIIEKNGVKLAAHAGPNHWNDPDMLEVGNGGMTRDEYRAHFGMWAMMAAPLIAGNDLTKMDQETTDILTNKEVIAVDQDAMAVQGSRVREDGKTSVWVKPLGEYGARAVALLNAGEEASEITFTLREANLAGSSATLRDLWEKKDLDEMGAKFSATVAPHSMLMLKVVGAEPSLPRGKVDLSDLAWVHSANGLGPVEVDASNGATPAGDGGPISLGGEEYERGLGVAAGSLVVYRLGKKCDRFQADIGVDDQTNDQGSVAFQVIGDDELLFESEVLKGGEDPQKIDVDVSGVYRLKLRVTNGYDGKVKDIASWGDPRLECEE